MSTKKIDPKIEWGFFAVVPRIVRTQYKDLTHADKWLYTCLKDLCGDKGTCFRTLRSLKEETDISIASLSTMIPKLHDAGLIHAEKKRRSNSGKEVWHITIIDVWQSNKDYCSKIEQSQDEIVQNLNNVVQKLNDPPGVCSENERDCSNFSDRRITHKNNTIEERTIEEESITFSPENVAPALSSEELHEKVDGAIIGLETVKRITDKHKAVSKDDIADAPTKKMKAVSGKKPVTLPEPAPKFELTAEQQHFWSLWCGVWFNQDIPPEMTETAYKHVVKLAPHITSEQQMNSLIDYTRKDLQESQGIRRKAVQLGNCVNSYRGWKQLQQELPPPTPEEASEFGHSDFDRYVGNGPEEREKLYLEGLERERNGTLIW